MSETPFDLNPDCPPLPKTTYKRKEGSWRQIKALRAVGVKYSELPKRLKPGHIIYRSKTGRLGQIMVRRFEGLVPNKAAKTITQFEHNLPHIADVAEKLSAVKLTKEEQTLVDLILTPRKGPRHSLARMIAMAGADPAQVIQKYAEGCILLGKADVLAEAGKHLGQIGRQLVKEATIHYVKCITCLGAGVVRDRIKGIGIGKGGGKEVPCPTCTGEGKVEKKSKDYRWATTQLLKMTKVIEPQGVTVNQNVVQGNTINNNNLNVGFMEKLSKLTDGSLSAPEVMEAEVVEPESSTEQREGEDEGDHV